MDKAAVGFDYKSQAEKHDSQKGEPQQPGELGKLGEVGDLGEQRKLRELDELEGLGLLEEVGEPAEGREQGWSWGLPTRTMEHCAGLLQSAARMVEELQGAVGNGSGEESHCTVHGFWKEFRLKEEQKSSVGIGISWTAYHQRKGEGEAQAGANSSRPIPGRREGCCCSTSGEIWPCSMSESWAQKTCEKSLNSHCCHLSPSLPCLFSSMP